MQFWTTCCGQYIIVCSTYKIFSTIPNQNTMNQGEDIKPRINGQMLSKLVGRSVSIVGMVTQFNQQARQAQIKTSDDLLIVINLQPGEMLVVQQICEFIGNVRPDMSVDVESIIAYSDNFSMSVYNRFVALANSPKNAPLFWGSTV